MAKVKLELPKCQKEGCTNLGMECLVPLDYTKPIEEQEQQLEYYCSEHCYENGYCWMCGQFWGGVERFEFDQSHLCENCRSEIDAEMADEEADFEECT